MKENLLLLLVFLLAMLNVSVTFYLLYELNKCLDGG